jgi:RNA polymerase sigma-70 factor (ECF subfamily)
MPNSLDELYMRYMKDVHRYLLFLCRDPHAAEDIVQETFYRAYLYLDSCRGEMVKPWLFKVAHHALIDYKRKERRSRPVDSGFFEVRSHGETPEEMLLFKEQLSELDQAIAQLPEKHRQAVAMVRRRKWRDRSVH